MKVRRWGGQGAHTRKKKSPRHFRRRGGLGARTRKKKKDLKILVTLE